MANGMAGVLLNNMGAPPTTTSLVASLNPAKPNQVVTYTATVAGQSGGTLSGTVTFQDGGATIATVTLANNQAAYSTSYKKKQVQEVPPSVTVPESVVGSEQSEEPKAKQDNEESQRELFKTPKVDR